MPGASIEMLHLRAQTLKTIRNFFDQRGLLEVETPTLSLYPTLDRNLQSISTTIQGIRYFATTSPEYPMKRLLAAGSGSIYQICRCFRQDEVGARHNPEFTMIEWYRVGWDYLQLMEEVTDLMKLLLPIDTVDKLSYEEAFRRILGINVLHLTKEVFLNCCLQYQLDPADLGTNPKANRVDWLDYLMGFLLEPKLGLEKPVILYDFPATMTSLAKLHPTNSAWSQRFEVYYRGIELGNGYTELTDAVVQRDRFAVEQKARLELFGETLCQDPRLDQALRHGLPDCAGIAMGLDRILMVMVGATSLDEVLSFSWRRC